MRVRSEISIAFSTLLGMQVVTSLVAIALLGRMSPAIENILEQNVLSQEAAMEMMAALAVPSAESEERFAEGLARAEGNIHEEGEEEVLAQIRRSHAAALQGDAQARQAVVRLLRELSNINSEAMHREDLAARRLGFAGAWTAVLLGFLSFVLTAGISRRFTRRLGIPLDEMEGALIAARQGDIHRRVAVADSPAEIERIAASVNDLLDRLFGQRGVEDAQEEDRALDRAALLQLMDQESLPLLLLDEGGQIHAANRAALDLPPDERAAARRGEGWEGREFAGGAKLMLRPAAPAPPAGDQAAG